MSHEGNPDQGPGTKNSLPSAYQIGDTIVIAQSPDVIFPAVKATVTGVNFTESTVTYAVETESGRELVVESIDVDAAATAALKA